MSTPIVDMAGKVIGRWTVISFQGCSKRYAQWLCRCECGTERILQGRHLRARSTLSCGCLHKEVVTKQRTRHGQHRTPEYAVWVAMKQRCLNPSCSAFPYYGGRGIGVCERWHDFANFIADMGKRPSTKHTLERENNDKGYEPSNCIWATRHQQMNNRRCNVILELRGRSQTMREWSRELGFSLNALRGRIERGWSVERALTTPLAPTNTHQRRLARRARTSAAEGQAAP